MTKLSKNFDSKEFECPHCGKIKVDPKPIELLQKLRDKIMEPIFITSGYRCKTYNKNVGGYKNSPHITGGAVDCYTKFVDLVIFAKIAKKVGFPRIGLYNTFLHLDIIPPSPSSSWVRNNGIYSYFNTLDEAILFANTIQLW